MSYIYYHNPRCRKSRETLEFLKEKGVEPELFFYLKTPPSFSELKEVIEKLGIKPLELIRKNEKIYKEQFKGKDFTDDQWIEIMVENPKLIERPILITEEKAVIGRPKENVLELI
ncbi:MAG TPA: arsenate reductase (glutaredoxin) [Bacteroidetes bacterium]|nr:arsenate reductase (glutaredoxin) [Bacteroidota bacterium]